MMNEPIHIISLGAGVQSSTMALMAAAGEITPMPVAAVFADTQAEPKSVYTWLDWLEKQLPFPVHRVTKGNLADRSCSTGFSKKNNKVSFSSIPAYVLNEDGSKSLIPRQCTRDFKVDPIAKHITALRREHHANAVLWIGISIDEIYRVKENRRAPRVVNRHPLLEVRMRRSDCLVWMESKGFPKPPRSACIFCPYHHDREWRRLKDDEPGEFQKAVAFETRFQEALKGTCLRGVPFLHRSCKPLSEVDFSTEEERGQRSLDEIEGFIRTDLPDFPDDQFNNECEGMCGV